MSCFSCCIDDKKVSQDQDAIDSPKQRSLTDPCWLFIFGLSWLVLIFIAFWSLGAGNPNRIISGYDSFGNICGHRNKPISGVNWSGMDMRSKPYVFHLNPANVSFTMKLCVKKCADQNMSEEFDIIKFQTRSGSALYRYDFEPQIASSFYVGLPDFQIMSAREKDEPLGFGPMPIRPVNKQRPILSRCVGTDRIKLGNSVLNNIYTYIKNMEVAHKIVSDIYTSTKDICYSVMFAVGVSLLVTFTIHYLASIVSFVIMLLASIAMLALTIFSWFVYYDLKHHLNQIPSIEQFDDDLVNEKTFLVFSIFLTILTIIILIIAFKMRSRVGLMVALFDETAACIRSLPSLIFQPIWTCAVMIIFVALWTSVFMAIATAEREIIYNSTTTRFQLNLPARAVLSNTAGNVRFSDKAQIYQLESVKHELPKFITYALIFLVIMLFWSAEFILGCQQMTVAASVATWYFTRDKSSLTCVIGRAIRRVANFHLGSIALGSFLIVLFKIPRLTITLLEFQLKKYKDSSSCVNCLFKSCQCFWYCMENFIRYINHNAYTIIAIEGKPFCFSAQVAFNTLASNCLRTVTINTLGDFILFLGKCLVTASATIFGIYMIKDDPGIHYLAVPAIFIAVASYLIGHSMLSVYEMIIDTMFLCFVEDVNKNGNNPEGYFASEGLLRFAKDDIEMAKQETPMIAREEGNPSITTQPGKNNIPPTQPPRPIGFNYPNLVESTH